MTSTTLRRPVAQRLDQQLSDLASSQALFRRPARGWLRALRERAGLSHADVARKLGTTRQSYAQLELAEESGVISLNSLRRAAKAMRCQLHYVVLPPPEFSPAHRALNSLPPTPEAVAPAPTIPRTFLPVADDELPQHMR